MNEIFYHSNIAELKNRSRERDRMNRLTAALAFSCQLESRQGLNSLNSSLSRLMHDDLHWLVIPQRVLYTLAVTVHRCLRHRAPYLADYGVSVSRSSWSPASAICQMSSTVSSVRVRRSTVGTRAFSVAGPTVWNSLPDHLRDPAVDYEQFWRDLKTYRFSGHSKP